MRTHKELGGVEVSSVQWYWKVLIWLEERIQNRLPEFVSLAGYIWESCLHHHCWVRNWQLFALIYNLIDVCMSLCLMHLIVISWIANVICYHISNCICLLLKYLLLQNLLVICRLQRRGNPFGTVHGGLGDLDGILSAVPWVLLIWVTHLTFMVEGWTLCFPTMKMKLLRVVLPVNRVI